MALNDRNRRKQVKAAQKLLPDAQVVGYAIGRTGQNPVVVVGAMVGTSLLFTLALFLASGQFMVIGILPMLIVQHFISPPCGIVVADRGVALCKRSLWNGRPHDIAAQMGHGYVQPVEESLGRVKIMVGHDQVWMSKGEEAVLRSVIGAPVAPPAGPTNPPGQGFPPSGFPGAGPT